MKRLVEVTLPHHQYPIVIEAGLIDRLGESVAQVAPHQRAALVGDPVAMDLYADRAVASLEKAGYQVTVVRRQTGEKHKTLASIQSIYDRFLEDRLERRSPVIALGGGVTGDTVGFAAATYLRGVPFIQCPTTLLAMVDASVGGKVGVNVPQGKNLIGAFYQPHSVLIDPAVLKSLPLIELQCGLAECIKHGVIRDAAMLDWMSDSAEAILSADPSVLAELIERNVRIKAQVVMADEKEAGERAHLNFGHTFAHAIEATAGYGEIGHGQAVALGMIAATHLAIDMGLCQTSVLDRIVALIKRFDLPTDWPLVENEALMAAMRLDKKVKDQAIQFVLPDRLGGVVIRRDVLDEQVINAWASIRR